MGSTRLRARLQRVAVVSMTSALLVGGLVLAAEPAAAVVPSVASSAASVASSSASAPMHSSIVQMPARDTDAEHPVDTRAAAPIALVSGALLVVAVGGIALDVRRRRAPRVSE